MSSIAICNDPPISKGEIEEKKKEKGEGMAGEIEKLREVIGEIAKDYGRERTELG